MNPLNVCACIESCGIQPLIENALQGYATTVLAYGQTGSGKTYTMSGNTGREGLCNCNYVFNVSVILITFSM